MIGSSTLNIFLFGATLLLWVGCGTPSKQSNKSIIGPDVTKTIPEENIPAATVPTIPNGAIVADFNGDGIPFYTHVKKVDRKQGITTIGFENNRYHEITLSEIYGALVTTINLEGFHKDLLLITAKLKDPNFNKYFLFVLKNGQWKPVMNGFSIHKNNLTDTLIPIRIDPDNANHLLRHYSVFDLDETSKLGYTWRLLEESVPIENR